MPGTHVFSTMYNGCMAALDETRATEAALVVAVVVLLFALVLVTASWIRDRRQIRPQDRMPLWLW